MCSGSGGLKSAPEGCSTDLFKVLTPLHSCAQLLGQLLSEEEVQRVEDLTLQRALDRMSDLIYCPRCQAPALEDDDHCTQCPKCGLLYETR